MEWIDRILGLCVKSLLIGAHTESVLIIIEQPKEPRVAAPFLDVICLMKGFIETTETTTRIVILSREVHQGVTIDDTTIAAPVCWDFDDIGIPTMKIDINLTSPDVRDALIKDCNDNINDSSHYNDDSQTVQADAELLALNNLTRLEAFPAGVASTANFSFYTFRARDYSPDLDNISENAVSGILDLIPRSMEKIVWAGLDWLATAHRPLTCQEFAVALRHEESDTATAIIHHCQITVDPDIVFKFVSLFYGLVEVKENRVCLSTALQSHLSIDKSEESLIAEPPFRTLSSAREEITHRCYIYLHSWLHKDTTENATSGATEEQEQTEQERNQVPALLLYAIEHLFEFLKSDYFNGEEKAMTPKLKKAIEEFIADEMMLNRCLHTYKSKGNLVYPPWNITVPSLSRIQERLELSISDAMAVVLAPIRRHSRLVLDNGWQYVALGVIESNNEAFLLKADRCKMFDDENILKVAFEVISDKSSCVLAKSHPDFVQKHSAKLLGNAIRLDHSSFIKHILSQGDTLIKDHDIAEDGATILSSIAQFVAPISHPIVGEKYLKYARHISEAHSEDKRSPLHLAAISGNCLFIQEAITWIEDHEIAPAEALNDRDRFGATALFLASQHGHSDIVTQLIAAGADLAICDEQKQSPLHIASKMGNSKIVAKLVAAGANPNGQDQLKKTPLHLALENRHTAAAANLLLDYTLTTLRYQRSGRCGRYCRYVGPGATTGNILPETQSQELLSHFSTPSPDTSIVGTAKLREITIALPFITARILVSKSFVSVSATQSGHNVNVNLKDADGATPLIIAAKNNMVEIVKTLLRCDVDVCAKDQPHGQEAI
ncbi:hypothetical protein A0O28_0110340 [Trichoderma guizhouense]|uniref:Uncharacterized protein n=1 Tax=Trichoderma guizhouense TaxID=1491466 RepID=A0A1T3C578_9HYPO|nr:hypothetical protein A0O28_0110340 [Trichoderma guizhouense]